MMRKVCWMIAASTAWLAEIGLAGPEFRQYAGRQLVGNFRLMDETGTRFDLGRVTAETPVILVPGLYRCEKVCQEVRERLAQSLREVPLVMGRDYCVIFFSVNPSEPLAVARARKQEWLNRLGVGRGRAGVYFLLGDEAGLASLARQVGFEYQFDRSSGDYQHPAGCVVLTHGGRISRYLTGTRFHPRELELALRTAAAGKISRQEKTSGVLCPDGSWGAQLIRYSVQLFGAGMIAVLLYSMIQGRKNLQ